MRTRGAAGRAPDGRATMQDVAATAGVSVSTVSKVLNGRYGVASTTSAHVTEVIERLGYQASLVAQSLRSSRTNVIGVLVSDFEPFSVEVLKGAADAVRGTGYELIAYSAGGRVDEHVGWERRYLSRLMGTLVDGAVLVTPTVTDVSTTARWWRSTPMPVGAACRRSAPTTCRALVPASSTCSLSATSASAWSPAARTSSPRSCASRATGRRSAKPVCPVDEALLRTGGFEPGTARDAARALLLLADRPTAVFACNDLSALATLEVAAELGIAVPGHLSVLGFDDIPESAMAHPPLTTVQQPIRQMGHDALELLFAVIDGEQPARPTPPTLATTLVVRRSTAAPAGTGADRVAT